MIQTAGNRPSAPSLRRQIGSVRAGGGAAQPSAPVATPAPAQPSMGVLFQQLMLVLQSALSAIVGWFRRLFQPAAPVQPVSQPGSPTYLGPQQPSTSNNPVDQPLMPYPGMTMQQGQVTGAVGLTQVNGQAAVGGRVDARSGDTYVTGAAAVTRTADGLAATVGGRVASPGLVADGSVRVDSTGVSGQANVAGKVGDARVLGTVAANPEMAAGALTVTSPKVQGAIAGVVTKDSTTVAGAVAAQVGKDGALRAAGLYQNGPGGVRANAQASYQDPTTAAGVRYAQDNETRAVGGFVDKRLPHSTLSLGGDYLWSPQGDGGRAYGRWQSDPIGEPVGGFRVRGGVEAGALKLPGQDWSTYAAGRITAEKDNAALFTEINHQAGPGFSHPDTSIKFGGQFRF